MNPIDGPIIEFLNQFATRSATFDLLVWMVANNFILKSGVIIALVYWAWFRNDRGAPDHRATMIFGLIASCTAVAVARIIALALPFRERPLRSPDLHFTVPTSMNPHALIGWSSFPSDTATLLFGVSACLFLVSRRAGLVAFATTAIVAGFARVYLGIHYPTDVLAAAMLGIGMVSLVKVDSLKTAVTRLPMRWLHDKPALAQTAFCLLVFLIGTTFEPVYQLGLFLIKVAKHSVEAI